MGKKKILLLSDDLRMASGISTISKEIVLGTIHKYDWIQVGAAIKNQDHGKFIDLSEDAKRITGVEDASLRLIPNNGYGDIFQLRELIKVEKPDAILHFTDPHYWQWLYDNEHEIRQTTPILYYHVWDNLPDPDYNKNYYESCDWIGCISKQTYGIVKRVGDLDNKKTSKPLENWQVSYVPHGINPSIYKPLQTVSKDIYDLINSKKKYDFILFYNNRNIRRKMTSDVIKSYKLFCDQLPKNEASKCLLLMHTNTIDENGTDLTAVIEKICKEYDVMINNQKYEQSTLNEFYNLVDCTINIANNEGFGLTTAESLMAGTPIIVNVTGGLQDQCGFGINGKEYTAEDYVKMGSLHDKTKYKDIYTHGIWCEPVWPACVNMIGSPMTPYIYDDRVNDNDVADSIMSLYRMSKEERKRRGLAGRDWMMKNLSNSIMCEKMIEGIENTLINFKPRRKYELYKII